MAEAELEHELGFVDKRRVQGGTAAVIGTPANYYNTTSLRARLTAINSTLYSAANLNKMTKNDMVFALRSLDDTAGI